MNIGFDDKRIRTNLLPSLTMQLLAIRDDGLVNCLDRLWLQLCQRCLNTSPNETRYLVPITDAHE